MVIDSVFKSMTDPTRRKILQLLLQNELGVSELVDVLGAPQSTVSRHLKTLRGAGLVDARQVGTSATYFPKRGQNGDNQNLPGQNSHGQDLRGRVLDWSASQEMPAPLKSRLDSVLRKRRTESDAFFSEVAHRWDAMRNECFGSSFHLEAITALLPREWKVIDVGCGTGYLLPLLAERFAEVIAVDPVDEMLDVCRQRVSDQRSDHVSFRKGSATRLPIEDGSVDLCIASLVLHHEPLPQEAMKEFHRVLRPGGQVLIIEQKTHTLTEFHAMMQDRWWGFEPDTLSSQLAQVGLTECRVHELRTAGPAKASDTPELFAVTGRKVMDEQMDSPDTAAEN